MDPFDEFEFKPLTDGLGFHRKSVSLKEEVESSELAQEKTNQNIPQRPSALFEDIPSPEIPSAASLLSEMKTSLGERPQRADRGSQARRPKGNSPSRTDQPPKGRQKPLMRETSYEARRPQETHIFDRQEPQQASVELPAPIPVGDPMPPPQGFPDIEPHVESPESPKSSRPLVEPRPFASERKGGHQSPRRQLNKIPFSFLAASLDSVVIGSISLLFLVVLLFVADLNVATILAHVQIDPMTQVSLGVMVFAVIEMYMVISRSFFGNSLGEWAFDIQLGDDLQQKQGIYPVKVVLRTLLNAITGFLTLPVLSMIARRDLAGLICRIQLFRY